MTPSSTQRLFDAWERALGLTPARRALELLRVILPSASEESLVAMTVGQRDGALMDLRAAAFGRSVAAVSNCPSCENGVEINFRLDDIRARDDGASPDCPGRIERSGWSANYRVPNGDDLLRVEKAESEDAARQLILARCLSNVVVDGRTAPVDQLPEEAEEVVSDAFENADPLADVQLSVTCPNCGEAWEQVFDVLSFLWTELDGFARRLLSEIHVLARVYGWSEREILSLSPLRRNAYLNMVTR